MILISIENKNYLLDIKKAKELLNWMPKVDRSEGLKLTYEYFKSLTKEELFHTEHSNFDKFIIR